MNDFIEVIRAAFAPDASAETRAAGAQACRTLLSMLEPPPTAPQQPAIPPIANIVAALRNAPPEQLLDLAIQKLRAAVPAGTEISPAKPLTFQFVPVRGAKR